MRIPSPSSALLAALFLISGSSAVFAAPSPRYHLVHEIPIGGEGGWDYLSVDPVARKLYVSQATRVVVVDLEQDKVTGEIADTPGVHGFAIAPELGRGFSSNGKEGKVSIVDLKTLKTLSKTAVGENPDAIVFESGKQEIYAFNGRSLSASVLDARTGTVTNTFSLAGRPEFAVADPEKHRVFVNLEDRSLLVAIDTFTHQISASWPLAPGETPTGLAIDLKNQHLFVGCENHKMILMDASSGKVLSSVAIGEGVDMTAFDPGTGLAFSSNGEGTVTIAREQAPGKLEVVQTLKTEQGARTMALDPKTHRIYLTSAKFDPAPPAEGHRHKIIPGSIKVLVFEPQD